MSPLTIFAPAKLNLFLAITGRRDDGFHDLVSLVAPLDFGDTLRVELAREFSLRCDAPDVPQDATNLVLKAAHAFAVATQWRGGAAFTLEKRIPAGAGLGGGSSDAVAALRAMNRLAEAGGQRTLLRDELAALAAQLGSDCPLFLHDRPVVMRGRGERITPVGEAVAQRLCGRRVLVFKPGFGIATPWAYAQLAAGAPASYLPADAAEAHVAAWMDDAQAPIEKLLFNTMEAPAFAKFIALPALFDRLREKFGAHPRMSGSGSACFVVLNEGDDVRAIVGAIRDAWGDSAFVVETSLT